MSRVTFADLWPSILWREVQLRTAAHDDAIYIDLGDGGHHVVRINADGWSVVSDVVPVLFRRTKLTGALPLPQTGGDINEMFSVVSIATADRPLVLAFMVSTLVQPDVPHPVLTLFAEQGSGKSSATRRIVDLTDPSPVTLRKAPRDAESWTVAASGSWVVALDNLSRVPEWFSDALCRASTGDGDVKRALYTDADLAVVKFRRCVIANGIDVGALRGDLSERILSIEMQPIEASSRLQKKDICERWEKMYPRVFGALLDLCAQTMAAMPDVELRVFPRMADFAILLAAVDRVLETDGLRTYLGRAGSMAQDSLSADAFITYLRVLVSEEFQGTSAELLAAVSAGLGAIIQKPRGWPRDPREVTSVLTRNAPALRLLGWTVTNDKGHNQAGTLRWRIRPPSVGDTP